MKKVIELKERLSRVMKRIYFGYENRQFPFEKRNLDFDISFEPFILKVT